jgi:DNA-binding MarR family transcriptional regulator
LGKSIANMSTTIDLSSAPLRGTLAVRLKPYWHVCAPGAHLGYYKGARGGAWYGRKFVGDGKYQQVKLGASQDDDAVENGLSFDAAMKKLLRWAGAQTRDAAAEIVAQPPRRATAARALRSTTELQPHRLDAISLAWAQERPDVDFWLASFFLRIEYAHSLHERRVQDVAKLTDTNVGDLHVLLALRRNGPDRAMRPTDLYRTLLVTSGAITKRLESLRAQKLIERIAAQDDRRSELVKLTRRGQAIADDAMTHIAASLASIVKASGVSRTELRQINEGLRRLIDAM